jgi:hypothetical protein
MVLLDDVVIRTRSATTATPQLAGVLQFRDGTGIRWMAIDVDHAWL